MTDPLIIRNGGKSVDFTVPADNDPTGAGWMIFRLTTQSCRARNGLVPVKACLHCQRVYPAIAFIKSQRRLRNGYALIEDTETCYQCAPPPVFRFTFIRQKLAMVLTLRDSTGAPIRVFDEKIRRYLAMANVGLRRMTNSNQIRMQPYRDRGHDKDGFPYGYGSFPLDGGER